MEAWDLSWRLCFTAQAAKSHNLALHLWDRKTYVRCSLQLVYYFILLF